jgi:hypothetical protein
MVFTRFQLWILSEILTTISDKNAAQYKHGFDLFSCPQWHRCPGGDDQGRVAIVNVFGFAKGENIKNAATVLDLHAGLPQKRRTLN